MSHRRRKSKPQLPRGETVEVVLAIIDQLQLPDPTQIPSSLVMDCPHCGSPEMICLLPDLVINRERAVCSYHARCPGKRCGLESAGHLNIPLSLVVPEFPRPALETTLSSAADLMKQTC